VFLSYSGVNEEQQLCGTNYNTGSARELCSKLVAELQEKGPAVVMKSISSETKTAFQQSMKGNRDEAIKKRVSGQDDLTSKYLGKMNAMVS
jgi:hypothetical protein